MGALHAIASAVAFRGDANNTVPTAFGLAAVKAARNALKSVIAFAALVPLDTIGVAAFVTARRIHVRHGRHRRIDKLHIQESRGARHELVAQQRFGDGRPESHQLLGGQQNAAGFREEELHRRQVQFADGLGLAGPHPAVGAARRDHGHRDIERHAPQARNPPDERRRAHEPDKLGL